MADSPTELEQRLENWGAALRARDGGGQCGSIEGDYRSPQRRHWELPASPAPGKADGVDAAVIEGAVCLLPLRYHALLRAWYVRRSAPSVLRKLAKRIGFKRPADRDIGAALTMAEALLVKQLELPAVMRNERTRRTAKRLLEEGA